MSSNHIYTGYPKVTTDLATEPVTLSEFKAYAHITYTDDDTVLTAIVKSARLALENFTGKSFGTKTIEVIFGTSGKGINLPKGPVDAITTIEYLEGGCCGQASGWETYTGLYGVIGDRFCAPENDYKITYTTAFTVTEDIKTAIKAQALHMWENRGDDAKAGSISPLAKTLIFPYVNGANLL